MNSNNGNHKNTFSPHNILNITEYLNQHCPITTKSDNLIASLNQQIEAAKGNSTIIEGVHFTDSVQLEKESA